MRIFHYLLCVCLLLGVSAVRAAPDDMSAPDWGRSLLPLCGVCDQPLWLPGTVSTLQVVGPGAEGSAARGALHWHTLREAWRVDAGVSVAPTLGYAHDRVAELFYGELLGSPIPLPHTDFLDYTGETHARLLGLEVRKELDSGNTLYTRIEQYSQAGPDGPTEHDFRATVLQLRYAF